MFDFCVAGTVLFELRRNGVDVRGVRAERNIGAAAARFVDELLEQKVGPVRAFVFQDAVERFKPLLGFLRIGIRDVLHIHGFTFVGFAASGRDASGGFRYSWHRF